MGYVVHLVKKKSNGRVYLYLSKRARVKGKSKVVWQKYLGPENRIEEIADQIILQKKDYTLSTIDFGLPVVLMQLAKRLQLISLIDQEVPKRHQGLSVGEYMLIAVLNRCCKPKSKAQIKKWFDSTYLAELFPKIDTYLNSDAYSNHFDYLEESIIATIESNIHQRLISEFNVKMDQLFYDPTNFFTFINPKDQTLPRHGKSKESRNTLNLVSLSLFCSQDGGIPIMHQTYAGNIHDATHFKQEYSRFIHRLKSLGIDNSTITLVFDKGNLSEDVFKMIESSDLRFVCSVRPSSHKDLSHLVEEDFDLVSLPNRKKIGVREYSRELYQNTYRLLVCYNPSHNKWSRRNKLAKIEQKISLVNEWFGERLNVKKWRSPEEVRKKIESIISKKEYFNYIDFTVEGDFGNVSYQISLNNDVIDSHLASLGKSYLLTNIENQDPVEIAWLYRQQFTVERAFKYLKQPNVLQIRPIYHRKDESIQGHIFSCILGLLLLTLLEREVKYKYPEMSIHQILEHLSEIEVIRIEHGQNIQYEMVAMSPSAKLLAEHFQLEKAL